MQKFYFTYIYPMIVFLVFISVHNSIHLRHHSKLRVVRDIGKMSLLIYLIHTKIMYDLLGGLFKGLAMYWVLNYLVIIVVVLVISYAVAKLIAIPLRILIKKYL